MWNQTISRKLSRAVSVLFAVLLLLCSVTSVWARYTLVTTGSAFDTKFELTTVTSADGSFVVDDKTGQTSNPLWGAADGESGAVDTSKVEEYSLSKLQNVTFSIYNNTEQAMLVTFDFVICLKNNFSGSIGFSITNTANSGVVSGSFVASGGGGTNIQMTKGSRAYKLDQWPMYYWSATVNPKTLLGDTEQMRAGFVVPAGQTAVYAVTCDYNGADASRFGAYACYSSVKISAVPYAE